MRVNGPGPTESSSKTKKKPGATASGQDFDALLSAGDTNSAASAAPATEITGISALLALQNIAVNGDAERKAISRGEELLEELNALRMGLLAGLFPASKLEGIAELVKQGRNDTIDPKLQDILNDIEVRALVEIEKYKKSQSGQ